MSNEWDGLRVKRLIWRIAGDMERTWYDTKMDAERAARINLPDENPDKRYARIQFDEVWTFEKETRE